MVQRNGRLSSMPNDEVVNVNLTAAHQPCNSPAPFITLQIFSHQRPQYLKQNFCPSTYIFSLFPLADVGKATTSTGDAMIDLTVDGSDEENDRQSMCQTDENKHDKEVLLDAEEDVPIGLEFEDDEAPQLGEPDEFTVS